MLLSDGARSRSKEALPTTTEEAQVPLSTTLVQEWAESVVSGTDREGSRSRVIEAFQDLPQAIENQELLRAYYRTINFVNRHQLKEVTPILRAVAGKLPDKLSAEQLELLFFTTLVTIGAQESDTVKELQVNIHLDEFGSRLGHAKDFNSEDWLTSLLMIGWYKGEQRETQAKTKVRDLNLQYLLGLILPRLLLII